MGPVGDEQALDLPLDVALRAALEAVLGDLPADVGHPLVLGGREPRGGRRLLGAVAVVAASRQPRGGRRQHDHDSRRRTAAQDGVAGGGKDRARGGEVLHDGHGAEIRPRCVGQPTPRSRCPSEPICCAPIRSREGQAGPAIVRRRLERHPQWRHAE